MSDNLRIIHGHSESLSQVTTLRCSKIGCFYMNNLTIILSGRKCTHIKQSCLPVENLSESLLCSSEQFQIQSVMWQHDSCLLSSARNNKQNGNLWTNKCIWLSRNAIFARINGIRIMK